MRAQFRSRIRFILGFLIVVTLGIFLRLYFVQIVHGEDYSLKADRQFSSGSSGLFDRGAIYFTRKDGTLISAATLSTGFLRSCSLTLRARTPLLPPLPLPQSVMTLL